MSGTSMDGLDIAYCKYNKGSNNQWQLSINQTSTVKYPDELLLQLKESITYSANQLLKLDKELGLFFAQKTLEFIHTNSILKKSIDAIASHGHTIFHQPDKGYTYQIGCGDTIAFHTQIEVINNFRQKDIIAGGQGAPLVPIGDKLLFSKYSNCFLNLGGFANCSVLSNDKVIAFDISPANLPLNLVINELGFEYDRDGEIAKSGEVNTSVLKKLNELSFYKETGPKSLGTEWLFQEFMPLLSEIKEPKDRLRTCVEHVAIQISNSLNQVSSKCLTTGGGVKNNFLLERINHFYLGEIIIPKEEIIDFKEAIIFGFLGALFLAKIPNTISSVTGASKDTIGGELHLP